MPKLIKDMAVYLKSILPSNIPETYSIKPIIKSISTEENIRKGVLGFRDFLYHLYDCIILSGSLYDKPYKDKHEFEDNTSLPIQFPFINHIESILVNIGFYGKLADDGDSLVVTDWQQLTFLLNANIKSNSKMTESKFIEGLRFLLSCGINFDGIGLDAKKPDMSKTESVKVSYLNNSIMLTGLKVMAIAQNELRTSGHEDFFLRCDYRVLKEEKTDLTSIFRDIVNPLPEALQEFALKLHQRFIDDGLKPNVEARYFRTRFTYSFKSKEICTISQSLKGYSLMIKAKNILNFPDAFIKFPEHLQQKISKGFGCYRKRGGERCDGGCQGYRFSFNNSLLELSQDIEIWLGKELSYLKGK